LFPFFNCCFVCGSTIFYFGHFLDFIGLIIPLLLAQLLQIRRQEQMKQAVLETQKWAKNIKE